MIHCVYRLKGNDGRWKAVYLPANEHDNLCITEDGFKVESLNICKTAREAIELKDSWNKQFDEDWEPKELTSITNDLCDILNRVKKLHRIAEDRLKENSPDYFHTYEDKADTIEHDLDSIIDYLYEAKTYLAMIENDR